MVRPSGYSQIIISANHRPFMAIRCSLFMTLANGLVSSSLERNTSSSRSLLLCFTGGKIRVLMQEKVFLFRQTCLEHDLAMFAEISSRRAHAYLQQLCRILKDFIGTVQAITLANSMGSVGGETRQWKQGLVKGNNRQVWYWTINESLPG